MKTLLKLCFNPSFTLVKPSAPQVMEKMEQWILEHMQDPKRSALKRLVPSVGGFYTHLKLVDALRVRGNFLVVDHHSFVFFCLFYRF